jgi:hypothetical protein
MKLTYKSVLNLRGALTTLDGLDKSVEVRGQAQLIKKPFKIARNLRATAAAFEDYDAARVGLVREISDGADQVPAEKIPEFSKKLADLLAEETDVALAPLTEAELNLDDNEIPHGALAMLLEFLMETEKED